jgi:hypothetical protein
MTEATTTRHTATSTRWIGLLVVLIVAVIGALLALQGWKARTVAIDLVVDIDNAYQIAVNSRVPDKGVLNSFASYSPPGVSWLVVPGVSLFTDPRLFQFPSSIALYAGTLVGIFLLARLHFGLATAILAVVLYGFSDLGLTFAESVWHKRPLPFFYVWMVYWTTRWMQTNQCKYLLTALVTWGAGLFVFMDMAPAVFIFPAIWLIYRPRLKQQALWLAAGLSLLIWYPYLQFQFKRDFLDLRSQVLRYGVLPAAYKDSWCDSTLLVREVTTSELSAHFAPPASTKSRGGLGMQVLRRYQAIEAGLLSNFERSASVPGNAAFLSLLVLVALATLPLLASPVKHRVDGLARSPWVTGLAVAMIACGVLANEVLLTRYVSPDGILEPLAITRIRMFQVLLVIGGFSLLLLRKSIFSTAARLVRRAETSNRLPGHPESHGLLVLSLVIPWIILLLLIEPQRTNRLWWLWPLHAIFLAAAATYLLRRLNAPRLFRWIAPLWLLSTMLANPQVLSRVAAWSRDGWSRNDSEVVAAVDYVAAQIKSEGKNAAAIGYNVIVEPFYVTFNAVDPRYKAGADWDLFFKYRHGIMNTNRCAEGVSSKDDYRIVQAIPERKVPRRYIIDALPHEEFKIARRFEFYDVYRRH